MIRAVAVCLALSAAAAEACDAPPWIGEAMPGSRVERDGAAAGPVAAWFADPTDRYDHGVLGDAIEAGTLVAQLDAVPDCRTARVALPDDMVFEDLAPRLADLDGDGLAEIVVVRSHVDLGAQLAVYGVTADGQRLELVAATPHIGQRNRWLSPAGIADLDEDGLVEIAYVDRPHLARILRIWRFVPDEAGGGALVEVAEGPGFTNHRIGEDFISGGLRQCGTNHPELILATADWSGIQGVTFANGAITATDLGPWYPERVALLLDGCPATLP